MYSILRYTIQQNKEYNKMLFSSSISVEILEMSLDIPGPMARYQVYKRSAQNSKPSYIFIRCRCLCYRLI